MFLGHFDGLRSLTILQIPRYLAHSLILRGAAAIYVSTPVSLISSFGKLDSKVELTSSALVKKGKADFWEPAQSISPLETLTAS